MELVDTGVFQVLQQNMLALESELSKQGYLTIQDAPTTLRKELLKVLFLLLLLLFVCFFLLLFSVIVIVVVVVVVVVVNVSSFLFSLPSYK